MSDFTEQARAEAERLYRPGNPFRDVLIETFMYAAKWAREQEPTEAQIEMAAEAVWNRYGDRGMWAYAPKNLRTAFLADARIALLAAQEAGR